MSIAKSLNNEFLVYFTIFLVLERCNGMRYCLDGSDEWNCDCKQHTSLKCACKLLQNDEVCLGDNSCFTEDGNLINSVL